ncbi:MAG: DUF4162 domain-containing protein [Candidatus Omnitrophica bacterium]|nr:DUF4162 domain-containing protein [Candidatus Omnitrophota bacterium]
MKESIIELVSQQSREASKWLRALPGIKEVQVFGDRLNLVVSDPDRDFLRVEEELKEREVKIIDHRLVPPSLENVFISLLSERGEK